MKEQITPFQVAIDDRDLADLADRLARTRWPEREPVEGWSQGVPLDYLKRLCEHWADAYDWRVREARMNAFPQFRVEIDGLGIHFLHVRSPVPDALPLVMTHGWPGSVLEFLEAHRSTVGSRRPRWRSARRVSRRVSVAPGLRLQ